MHRKRRERQWSPSLAWPGIYADEFHGQESLFVNARSHNGLFAWGRLFAGRWCRRLAGERKQRIRNRCSCSSACQQRRPYNALISGSVNVDKRAAPFVFGPVFIFFYLHLHLNLPEPLRIPAGAHVRYAAVCPAHGMSCPAARQQTAPYTDGLLGIVRTTGVVLPPSWS